MVFLASPGYSRLTSTQISSLKHKIADRRAGQLCASVIFLPCSKAKPPPHYNNKQQQQQQQQQATSNNQQATTTTTSNNNNKQQQATTTTTTTTTSNNNNNKQPSSCALLLTMWLRGHLQRQQAHSRMQHLYQSRAYDPSKPPQLEARSQQHWPLFSPSMLLLYSQSVNNRKDQGFLGRSIVEMARAPLG